MLRLLKMLVLPLVAVSMVSGVCALQQSGGQGVRRLSQLTFLYYTGGLEHCPHRCGGRCRLDNGGTVAQAKTVPGGALHALASLTCGEKGTATVQ